MPIATTREGRLYVITFTGGYQVDEVFASFRSILDADDFPKNARIVLDLRTAESVVKRSISDLRRIAGYFVEHAGAFDNRVALIVDGLARYGLMRMVAAWVERDGVAAAVFRDPDEARRWVLGIARLDSRHPPP